MDKFLYKPSAAGRDMLREENLTYDDYASWDDGNRYELVDGRLELMSPGPNTAHQWISMEILKRITQTCSNEAVILAAPLDVILSPREVRQPDLVVVLRQNLHIVTKRGIEGAPDIVAEILSPSTAKRDKIGKMRAYAAYGIPEYWIVDPAACVLDQYMLAADGKYELSNVYAGEEPVVSPRLPCLAFAMQEIADSLPEALR
ncbi:Uma2 family endonuclease [Paenibacillus antri]|uniref:Uma2 family endonuclease n=1 Tax=Paenibacillus antri TaxID=2582848 RepID=A0A5R9GC47_9BACL|nr:Uma2 family endonuclease [Paenibacillus antri]TLS51640.1 Uma2 family endonuclease [Paenibacillus antri]